MKGNLLKKLLAFSLGLFVPIELSTSAFAGLYGEFYEMQEDFIEEQEESSEEQEDIIKLINDYDMPPDYCLGNQMGCYYVYGANFGDKELFGDDFNPEFLNETVIGKLQDGITAVYNFYCTKEIMLVFTALHVVGCDKETIIEFIKGLKDSSSWEQISARATQKIMEFESKVNSENFDLALDLISLITK